MPRYILIDNHSGYIWGDSADLHGKVFSGTAVEYAQALDESLKEGGRAYMAQPSADAGQTGYHVYRADIGGSDAVTVVHDGQDRATIDAVTEFCRYEGFIAIKHATA